MPKVIVARESCSCGWANTNKKFHYNVCPRCNSPINGNGNIHERKKKGICWRRKTSLARFRKEVTTRTRS